MKGKPMTLVWILSYIGAASIGAVASPLIIIYLINKSEKEERAKTYPEESTPIFSSTHPNGHRHIRANGS